MRKTLLITILSLAAGFAAGAWTTSDSQPTGPVGPDATASKRIEALERIVAEERDARLILEEQMYGLYSDLGRLDVPELHELIAQMAANRQREEERALERQRGQSTSSRERRRGMRDYAQMRTERLVAGGFTQARANQVLKIEDQVRMDALQAEYEATLAGEQYNPWAQAYDFQDTLRGRIGDAEYERYLQAHGSQAAVTVREVIGTSPANRAGLRPGDQIVSYDGSRVFSMYELKSKAFDGQPGEDVVIDIERDGQRMQLVMPRGPLGITGQGASVGPRGMIGG